MTFRLLYAFHRTPIGKCLIVVTDTDKSVTYLRFNDNEYDNEAVALKDLKAQEFQIKIWKSLTGVPRGTVTTYEEVVWMVGCDSKTAIAVGNACSRNYITYIVPCHCMMPQTCVVAKKHIVASRMLGKLSKKELSWNVKSKV